ncbi:MAG: hypothetical protein RL660_1653 [Bacteroidota bacterium]|jgi:ABC-type multidrug transport system ATPase subunit
MTISLQQASKRYFNTWIFKDLSLEVLQGDKLAILGINGSGKSTLMQCISGHVGLSDGKVIWTDGNKAIDDHKRYEQLSFCSPSMQLIEDFTLQEFLQHHFAIKPSMSTAEEAIAYIGLNTSADKRIEVFSSGMKQRVKLAQALMAKVPVCFLDEPCSNLDEQGIQLYNKMVHDFGTEKTIFVSSNDAAEYQFCNKQILVQDYQ